MALSGNQITRVGDMGTPGRAYAGFTAKALAATVETEGLEYKLATSRLHYVIPSTKLHYTISDNE